MNATNIAKWYTGKALKFLLEVVFPTLAKAEETGYWQPGDSRKIHAALNKQAVAARFGKANDRDRNLRDQNPTGKLDDVCDTRPNWWEAKAKGGDFVHAMMFGSVGHAPRLVELGAALESHCVNDEERAVLATARQWAEDFAPVAVLLERLDATRPLPVYVIGTISPTVHANVAQAMAIDFATVECPKTEWTWVEMQIKGKTVRVPIATILWPEGTRHNTSRYCTSEAGNDQCQACGHAIRSGLFVPLVAETRTGPVSLWVGRDCARNLFAIDVKGDVKFTTGPSQAAP